MSVLPESARGDATAGAFADESVSRVRDDPQARLALLRQLYQVPAAADRGYLPYRRAASAFMGWQLRRGLLDPESSAAGQPLVARGERLPAAGHLRGLRASPSDARETLAAPASSATLGFIRDPTARTWYRAHNTTIASAYLAHEDLAWREGRVERFFINLVLVRVLYAHALVSAPRLGDSDGWPLAAGCSATPGSA